jgi:hypothetical protein
LFNDLRKYAKKLRIFFGRQAGVGELHGGREGSLAGPSAPPLAFIETRRCPLSGLIFFMFQRGLGLATEPTRMAKRLITLSNPRFSLFDRTSGRFSSLDESPIKQGFFVNFASDRLQPCQILSRDQRK